MLIRFKVHFSDYPIKTLRIYNIQEFGSRSFEDYCIVTGIDLTYSVPYEHAQNGLAESFIKWIQLIIRPLFLHANLPVYMGGYAVLHVASLIKLHPSSVEIVSSQEFFSRCVSNVFHLRVFGCRVWIPLLELQNHIIGTHRQEGIYIGFYSPCIIRYINLSTGSLFHACFANCGFGVDVFPSLKGGTYTQETSIGLTFGAPQTFTSNFDPRTSLAKIEVTKILHLQKISDQTPDNFNDALGITKTPLNEAQNLHVGILIPKTPTIPNSQSMGKRTRGPDKQPRKHKTIVVVATSSKPPTTTANFVHSSTFKETISKVSTELFVMYCGSGNIRNGLNIDLDEPFICMVVENLSCEKDDPEPCTIEDAMHRSNGLKGKAAIEEKYVSLGKRQVFEPIVDNLNSGPLGYKLVFVRKRNDKGQIIRYKYRLALQGFTQKFGIDYDITYSPVMDSITFGYLLGMTVHTMLEMKFMDVVTTYLYGYLNTNIYMKVSPELNTTNANALIPDKYCNVKLQCSLHSLKQSRRV